MYRFKTGTPARIDRRSIDFSKMEEQLGDERVIPFSFTTDPEEVQKEQVSCWLTYTNERTHEIIRENLDRSPLYSGIIEGTGPRYCPSIEDKVVKFADKNVCGGNVQFSSGGCPACHVFFCGGTGTCADSKKCLCNRI